MVCMNGRVIRPEWLDEMEPGEIVRPLRELVLINRFLGGHGVLRRTMAALAIPTSECFTFLDVGSATGDMGRCVRVQYPQAHVTSLDHRLIHLPVAAQP